MGATTQEAGLKLVPNEPTEAMLRRGGQELAMTRQRPWQTVEDDARDCWQAMIGTGRYAYVNDPDIRAAPTPEPMQADMRETIRSGASCSCRGVEMGSYDAQIELIPPAHMARTDGRGICIDACLALEVNGLWKKGITTTGCCCGHGKASAYIGVVPQDIELMKALGYSVLDNPSRPGDEDTFSPLSLAAMQAKSSPSATNPDLAGLRERLEAVRAEHLRLATWNGGRDRPKRVALHHDAAQAIAESIRRLASLK